jgi:hypothetical protein
MTPSELYTLIISDSSAKAAAIAGDDSLCAARCIEIAELVEADPPIEFSELGLIKIFATDQNPFAGGQFMAALRAMAESQEVYASTIKSILNALSPSSRRLPDFGNSTLISALIQLSQITPTPPITPAQVQVIRDACMVKPKITAADVSIACQPYRSNNFCGATYWTGA